MSVFDHISIWVLLGLYCLPRTTFLCCWACGVFHPVFGFDFLSFLFVVGAVFVPHVVVAFALLGFIAVDPGVVVMSWVAAIVGTAMDFENT